MKFAPPAYVSIGRSFNKTPTSNGGLWRVVVKAWIVMLESGEHWRTGKRRTTLRVFWPCYGKWDFE